MDPSSLPTCLPSERPSDYPSTVPSLLSYGSEVSLSPLWISNFFNNDTSFLPTFFPNDDLAYNVLKSISFESTMSVGGMESATLDQQGKLAFATACADSMQIDASFVTVSGTYVIADTRRLAMNMVHSHLESVTVAVVTTTTIPTTGEYESDPSALYNKVTSSLTNAVSSNAFATSLTRAASALGVSSLASVSVIGVEAAPMQVLSVTPTPKSPTPLPLIYPSSYPTSFPSFHPILEPSMHPTGIVCTNL